MNYSYGSASFSGISVNELIADKIVVISQRKVLRRSKDLMDMYALSEVCDFNTSEILGIIKDKNLKYEDFTTLRTEKAQVEHAYNKYKTNIKPDFEKVYNRVLYLSYGFDFGELNWKSTEAAFVDTELAKIDFDEFGNALHRSGRSL